MYYYLVSAVKADMCILRGYLGDSDVTLYKATEFWGAGPDMAVQILSLIPEAGMSQYV